MQTRLEMEGGKFSMPTGEGKRSSEKKSKIEEK